MARRSEQREAFAQRVYRARSAGERVELRLERVRATAEDLAERAERRSHELTRAGGAGRGRGRGRRRAGRRAARRGAGGRARAARRRPRDAARARGRGARAGARGGRRRRGRGPGAPSTPPARCWRPRPPAPRPRATRRRDERPRAGGRAPRGRPRRRRARRLQPVPAHPLGRRGARRRCAGARSLADALEVTPGYERAVAAALGGLLRASLAERVRDGGELLDAAGADGGRVLIVDSVAPGPAAALEPARAGRAPPRAVRRRRARACSPSRSGCCRTRGSSRRSSSCRRASPASRSPATAASGTAATARCARRPRAARSACSPSATAARS